MGGKDAIIVEADADIDAAVEGAAAAAFGFSGQKCSACSRLILNEKIYDTFLDKLKARVEKITLGDPTENPNMGPVVNEGSMKSILGYIEQGKKDGRLITGGQRVAGKDGYFVEPTVIADIQPKSKLEQEEIFGPVLAVIKARDYDHALEIANDTEFGLTGAVYSRDEKKLERAIARVPCREFVPESQVHGSDGGSSPVRRVQYVWNRLKGWWTGLPAVVHAGEIGGKEDFVAAGQSAKSQAESWSQKCLSVAHAISVACI